MSARPTKPVAACPPKPVAGMTPSPLPVKAQRILFSPRQAAPARTGRRPSRPLQGQWGLRRILRPRQAPPALPLQGRRADRTGKVLLVF
jgi:hypothetical protein